MANWYVSSGGNDVNGGTTWADAYLKLSALLAGETLTGGDRVFCRHVTISTQYVETLSGDTSFVSTNDIPVAVFAVKGATSNAPPTSSDLVTGRADSERALIDGSGGLYDILMPNDIYLYGFEFKPGDDFLFYGDGLVTFEECVVNMALAGGAIVDIGTSGSAVSVLWKNVTYLVANAATEIAPDKGFLRWYGGEVTTAGGATPTDVFDNMFHGNVDVRGVDFQVVGTSVARPSDGRGAAIFDISHCKLPGAETVFPSASYPDSSYSRNLAINCGSLTGLGSSDEPSLLDWRAEEGEGIADTTYTLNAGFSYKMTPRSGHVIEVYDALVTPWIVGKVNGNGTSKSVSVEILLWNAGGTPTALQDDEIWIEVFSPDSGGTLKYDITSDRMALLSTPVDQASSSASWAGAPTNPRRHLLAVNISPDYIGPVMARVHLAKAGLDAVYVDPVLTIA